LAKALVIHGGAGAWSQTPPERRAEAVKVVESCAKRGWSFLDASGDVARAVVESIKCMEDSGALNAGWGSVLDLFGGRSLDAGFMTSTGLIGAVGGVTATRNAIALAYVVATETPHILIVGSGADELARFKGLPPLPPSPRRVVENYAEYLKKLVSGQSTRPYIEALRKFFESNPRYLELARSIAPVYDTVGAVAVSDSGVLAAGVSTGGLMLKLPGRVGDSAIPGAGFYATGRVACSATGIGEMIIKTMLCLALDRYVAETGDLEKAAEMVMDYVNNNVGRDTAGFIAVDRNGRVTWKYNTEGMLVAYARNGEVRVTGIS